MGDLFLGSANTPEQRKEQLGVGTYVWGEGSNDVFLGGDRDLIMVSGTTKLQQDIIKSILTDRYRNQFYPLFGSAIRGLIGTKGDLSVIKTQSRTIVIEAIAVLQFINFDNPDLDEQIETIDIVKIVMDIPTQISISVQVTTKSGKIVNIVTVVS